MPAKLYSLSLSHPSQAARLMLERKGIDHEVVDLLAGFHPLQLRAAGFRGARMAGASSARVRADLGELPGKLDHVDELVAAGTIGGDEPNAADFQIGTAVRVLMAFEDLRNLVEGRPAGDLAMRVLPQFPGPIPRALPPDWL